MKIINYKNGQDAVIKTHGPIRFSETVEESRKSG
jgi:hypothetical protein